MKCPTITPNANSAVKTTSPSTCQTATKPTCEFGDVVVIDCDTGYEKADGTTSSTLTCQSSKAFDMPVATCQSKGLM